MEHITPSHDKSQPYLTTAVREAYAELCFFRRMPVSCCPVCRASLSLVTEGQGKAVTSPHPTQKLCAVTEHSPGTTTQDAENSYSVAVFFPHLFEGICFVYNLWKLLKTKSISYSAFIFSVLYEELRLHPLKAIHSTRTKATSFRHRHSKLYYSSASFLTYRIWKFRQRYLTLKSVEKNILTSFQVYLLFLTW